MSFYIQHFCVFFILHFNFNTIIFLQNRFYGNNTKKNKKNLSNIKKLKNQSQIHHEFNKLNIKKEPPLNNKNNLIT